MFRFTADSASSAAQNLVKLVVPQEIVRRRCGRPLIERIRTRRTVFDLPVRVAGDEIDVPEEFDRAVPRIANVVEVVRTRLFAANRAMRPDKAEPLRDYISMSPMPGLRCAGADCGLFATMHSVVRIKPATEAAFCSAVRVTLHGSSTPISTMFPYTLVAAL